MIRIQDLRFRYRKGDFLLRIPELMIESGSSVAIIGPSGTGKTTLLSLVAGILMPDSGTIMTCGEEVSRLDDTARRDFRIRNIGLVFQEFELLEYLTVLDNILLPYRISPALALNQQVKTRAHLLAEHVGIRSKLPQYIRRLSHGERQRVAICRAVLPEPGLLLCDEPTGNLDPASTTRVLDILFDDVKTRGTTLVVVTHEREHLDRFDQVIDFGTFTDDGGKEPD